MRYKNIMGLIIVSTFAVKGLFRLYQYYNYESDYNSHLAGVTNDSIDALKDLHGILSENKQEVHLYENICETTKNFVNQITENERRYNE